MSQMRMGRILKMSLKLRIAVGIGCILGLTILFYIVGLMLNENAPLFFIGLLVGFGIIELLEIIGKGIEK